MEPFVAVVAFRKAGWCVAAQGDVGGKMAFSHYYEEVECHSGVIHAKYHPFTLNKV